MITDLEVMKLADQMQSQFPDVDRDVLLGMADEMLHPFRPKDANLEQLKSTYASHTQIADAVDAILRPH